jgi:hypothetical protein
MKRKLLQVMVILGVLGLFCSSSTLAGEHPSKAKGETIMWECPFFPCI